MTNTSNLILFTIDELKAIRHRYGRNSIEYKEAKKNVYLWRDLDIKQEFSERGRRNKIIAGFRRRVIKNPSDIKRRKHQWYVRRRENMLFVTKKGD